MAATVLLWEAEPPDEARATVNGLGFTDVVFPTLATTPEASDYVKTFRSSIDELVVTMKSADG